MYLIAFVKDIFDIYLNNIYIILSFDYTWFVNVKVNIDCMRCLSTKKPKFHEFSKYMRIVLSLKQNCAFKSRNLICLMGGLCMQYC